MITNILTYLENSATIWAGKTAIADDKNSLTFAQWNQYSRNIGTAISKACNQAFDYNFKWFFHFILLSISAVLKGILCSYAA